MFFLVNFTLKIKKNEINFDFSCYLSQTALFLAAQKYRKTVK